MISKNKEKAQEEMIGFVLIIVLVSVIALIFLVISLRKPSEVQDSREIKNFLQAGMLYTTECQSNTGFYDLKELIEKCYNKEGCNEKDSCEVLNLTVKSLIENSFQIGEGAKYKAYEFSIRRINETFFYLSQSSLAGSIAGSEAVFPVSGENFYINLEISY